MKEIEKLKLDVLVRIATGHQIANENDYFMIVEKEFWNQK